MEKRKEGRALESITRFPLKKITSEEELDRAIEVVDRLIDRDSLEIEEKDYLDQLSDLIEEYETEVGMME